MKKNEKTKKILMEIPWDGYFGRQIQQGFCRHGQPHRPWVLFREWPSFDNSRLRGMGVVGMVSMRQPVAYTALARRYSLAAVGAGRWSPSQEFSGLPYVDVDPHALGEMAAEYFINSGFRHFGMLTSINIPLPRYRGEAFVAALRRRRLDCSVFNHRKRYPPCGEPLPAVVGASESLRRWLASLSKPLALFCIDDSMGVWACAVCQRTGLRVPDEISVLGVDDDHMFCEMSWPHLSSIRLPGEQIGHEAAAILDSMLRGRRVPKRPVLLPPMGVVTRQSTDVLAIDDIQIIKAVRFIRENAHRGIRVENVMTEASLPRRVLEYRFGKALGRGPFAEIRRVQIENIKTILAQTDKTLEAIAPECGFESVTRMSLAFKKATGMPPGAYRKQLQKH